MSLGCLTWLHNARPGHTCDIRSVLSGIPNSLVGQAARATARICKTHGYIITLSHRGHGKRIIARQDRENTAELSTLPHSGHLRVIADVIIKPNGYPVKLGRARRAARARFVKRVGFVTRLGLLFGEKIVDVCV